MNDNRDSLATQQVAGLRKLADLIEAHPELAGRFTADEIELNIHTRTDDITAELAEWARFAKANGAKIAKDITQSMYNVTATFCDGVKVSMLAYRTAVCEKVVVGTREVTEEVPDPEALAAVPTVTVKRVVEETKWVCRPLLAADTETAVA